MTDIALHWVLPDPNRERAADPLGTGAFADRLADQLVPDFSVATSRARYLSLLCAAVRKAAGSTAPLRAIHAIEADHAVREAVLHRDEPTDGCPGIVGRMRATAELKRRDWSLPARPERLYKSTAFAQYRSLMRALGLLQRGSAVRLTAAGEQLAAAYPLRGADERRCLSGITTREQRQLYAPLGLDLRSSPEEGSPQARRRATYQYLARRPLAEARTLIQAHARPTSRAISVAVWLHTAYAWETLSLGLLCGLSLLVHAHRRLSLTSEGLKAALSGRRSVPTLDEELDRNEAADHCVALLREALRVRAALPASCAPYLELAQTLVTSREPAEFLRRVTDQHARAKGGVAWFRLDGDRVVVIATGKNLDFRLGARSYRLDAYTRFLRDLGKL
jgi:hypothetical protein